MDTIRAAIEAIGCGKMVILVDDEDRENEGDLVIAAQKVTPVAINFMAKHGRGLICLALDQKIVDSLALPMMPQRNQSTVVDGACRSATASWPSTAVKAVSVARATFGTAFTVSIEAKHGVTTGISAYDRAHTIQVAIAKNAKPDDLILPGHVFPLRARPGGVIERGGQTEGSVDLARLAGLKPAGVICEIMNDDGTMARLPQLKKFAKKHELPLVSIKDLIEYRFAHENLIERTALADLPIELGDGIKSNFKIMIFKNRADGTEHVALVKGKKLKSDHLDTLIRIHSECLTGDVFGSARCDCGMQLSESLKRIETEGAGILIYLRSHEGRGIGLTDKIKAYALQDNGRDTVEANLELGFKPDLRHFGNAAQILKALGVKNTRILTNNPRKILEIQNCNISVTERIPLETKVTSENADYLKTKGEKLGHIFSGEFK